MTKESLKGLQAKYVAEEPLTVEEQRRLLKWLDESPEERHELLADEAMDRQLRCMARLNDDDLTEAFVAETIHRAIALQQRDKGGHVKPLRRTKRSRSLQSLSIFAGLSTVALVLVSVALTWYAMTQRQKDDFGFAHLENTKDVSWELVDEESRRISISSGHGEVHFENGVIVQLVAPAVVELRAPARMYVKSGAATIDVPPAATGFTVETPLARIVDFGTTFDVNVGEAGRTETSVRSGIVTFATHTTSPSQRAPIKLTVEGLRRASVELSSLTSDVRSITTIASGSSGQFLGRIDAGGESVAFDTRQEFDGFLLRLRASLKKDPSSFSEQWDAATESTANSMGRDAEGKGESDLRPAASLNRAQQMLIEQLKSMQEVHSDNPQMQELLERMIRQAEEASE